MPATLLNLNETFSPVPSHVEQEGSTNVDSKHRLAHAGTACNSFAPFTFQQIVCIAKWILITINAAYFVLIVNCCRLCDCTEFQIAWDKSTTATAAKTVSILVQDVDRRLSKSSDCVEELVT
jgi:hypothetical protein